MSAGSASVLCFLAGLGFVVLVPLLVVWLRKKPISNGAIWGFSILAAMAGLGGAVGMGIILILYANVFPTVFAPGFLITLFLVRAALKTTLKDRGLLHDGEQKKETLPLTPEMLAWNAEQEDGPECQQQWGQEEIKDEPEPESGLGPTAWMGEAVRMEHQPEVEEKEQPAVGTEIKKGPSAQAKAFGTKKNYGSLIRLLIVAALGVITTAAIGIQYRAALERIAERDAQIVQLQEQVAQLNSKVSDQEAMIFRLRFYWEQAEEELRDIKYH